MLICFFFFFFIITKKKTKKTISSTEIKGVFHYYLDRLTKMEEYMATTRQRYNVYGT